MIPIRDKDIIAINLLILSRSNQKQRLIFPEKLQYLDVAPYESSYGQENYPTISEKAGIIFIKLIKGHVFADGNKRTAVITLVTFLRINGYQLALSDDDLFKLTIRIAMTDNNQLDYETVYDYLDAAIKLK